MKRFALSFFLVVPAFAVTPVKPTYLSIDKPKAVTVKGQGKAELVLVVRVKEGFHVQANPASQPNLIATTLEVTAPEGVRFEPVVYPAGKPFQLKNSPMEVASYDGTFELRQPITGVAGAKPGKRLLEGKIRYQACNEQTCFPPTREPFTAEVRVR